MDVGMPGTPLLAGYHGPFKKYLEEIIKGEDKTEYIRALELLINLVTKDEKLVPLFEELLMLALNQYPTVDELTKLNIVEIVPELANHRWTSALLLKSNFIPSLLQPSGHTFVEIDHSVIIMTARAYAANPELFTEALINVYLKELQKLLESPKAQDVECALSALFITFKQKTILKHVKDRPDLLKFWLKHAKTTNGEIRIAFFVSLEAFLERTQESAEQHASLIYKVVTHLLHPDTIMTEPANLKEFLMYLVQYLNTPFPQEELAALHVLRSMLFVAMQNSALPMGMGSERGISGRDYREISNNAQTR